MIKFFTVDDCVRYLDDLLELDQHCFWGTEWNRTTWENIFSKRNFILAVYCNDKQIFAYSLVTIVMREAELYKIGVHSNCRNRGIAQKLMSATLARLNKQSVEQVFLEVRVDNRAAIEFYKKNGFEKVGLRKQYYRSPTCDGQIFKKRIGI